jgi:DNA-directed RNA polymerase subunit H (RpoH/RPB5)
MDCLASSSKPNVKDDPKFRAIKNLMRYVERRGDCTFEMRDFKKNDFENFCIFVTWPHMKARIYICRTFGIKNFKVLHKILDEAQKQDPHTKLIVVCDSCTAECGKAISAQKPDLEWFSVDQLQYYIFDSKDVDDARKADENEVKSLVKSYGPLKLFPHVKINDPIPRYLGLCEGDLVRFVRNPDIPGGTPYKFYRYVVK